MKRYRFEAALQRSTGWGAFVLFPHDTQTEFNIKGRVPIQALIGGHPYTGSLMPTSAPYHHLSIPKPIREALSKSPGDLIQIELWHDTTSRTVDLPDDFAKLLKEHKLLSAFEKANHHAPQGIPQLHHHTQTRRHPPSPHHQSNRTPQSRTQV